MGCNPERTEIYSRCSVIAISLRLSVTNLYGMTRVRVRYDSISSQVNCGGLVQDNPADWKGNHCSGRQAHRISVDAVEVEIVSGDIGLVGCP
jgi:hypothetical protein